MGALQLTSVLVLHASPFQMGLRQAIAPERMLGRVNANIRMTELGAMLVGSLVAGTLGEIVGLRLTLIALTCAAILGASWLWAPVRRLRDIPSREQGSSPPETVW